MMGIFQWIMDELPPLNKYWDHMFQNKSMYVVGECQSKVLPLHSLINDLFSTEDDTNKDTPASIGEMAVTAAKALLAKIREKKKDTAEHL